MHASEGNFKLYPSHLQIAVTNTPFTKAISSLLAPRLPPNSHHLLSPPTPLQSLYRQHHARRQEVEVAGGGGDDNIGLMLRSGDFARLHLQPATGTTSGTKGNGGALQTGGGQRSVHQKSKLKEITKETDEGCPCESEEGRGKILALSSKRSKRRTRERAWEKY